MMGYVVWLCGCFGCYGDGNVVYGVVWFVGWFFLIWYGFVNECDILVGVVGKFGWVFVGVCGFWLFDCL